MKQLILSVLISLFSSQILLAQESNTLRLSLQECMQMAVEKNINVKKALIDQEKSGYKNNETRATLLPKVNFSGSFQDNLVLPTTILPGEIIGKPGTSVGFQMGSQYTTSASVGISQVLYNQTALTAVKLSKKSSELSILSVEKASEEIAAEVAKLYFLTLTTAEQRKLIEENITRTEQLKAITKITVENGIGKQIDLDRVNVNLENYYSQLSNTVATQDQQMNMIKYILDIPLNQSILLTDEAKTILIEKNPTAISDFSNHIDIQLLESQKDINNLNQKLIASGYLPTLSLSGSVAYQGMRNDFRNYFKESSENKWYPNVGAGINLSIPLFDGFEKRSKSRQAKLDYKKSQETLENTRELLSMNYQNAINNYQNNKSVVRRQQQNLELAVKVYDETTLRYREGLAAMSNLLQDEISLSNAQAGYLTALYNFKDAELKIMSLNGGIKDLIYK